MAPAPGRSDAPSLVITGEAAAAGGVADLIRARWPGQSLIFAVCPHLPAGLV